MRNLRLSATKPMRKIAKLMLAGCLGTTSALALDPIMSPAPPKTIIVNGRPAMVLDPTTGVAIPLHPESPRKRTPSPLEEIIKEKERITQREMRSSQATNPDYHAYITGKMSGADRDKLEKRALGAGMSVKDYTALSPLERYKAGQRKRRH